MWYQNLGNRNSADQNLGYRNSGMREKETYYVVWRMDKDDFFFTQLDLLEGMLSTLSNDQVVRMAWDAEYLVTNERNPFIGKNPASYELVEIIGGKPTWHMK